MSSIVLIGFMGAGKTTVGKELVKKGFELIDTDAYIEACEKMSISDIFAQKGEDYFRQAETKALKTLLVQDKQFVISCGGGMPLRKQKAFKKTRHGSLFKDSARDCFGSFKG